MKGQVIKSENGRYYVYSNNKEIVCNARGIIKAKKEKILTGDFVEFEETTINALLPRKNRLIRPNVANIEQIAIVIAKEPKPDLLLVDKLIINAFSLDIPIFIVVNKSDLEENFIDYIKSNYINTNIEIISVSTFDKANIDILKNKLKNKLTLLAGQSAVGKTSIINELFNLAQRTNTLSKKTERGRHTTTYSKIYFNEEYKIIDSPGFAIINATAISNDLSYYYPDFAPYLGNCKFRQCLHINEPDCQIKKAVLEGKISNDRYLRYIQIYNELKKEERFNHE